MGTRVGPFVGHTSGFGYENKNICTYITRDKNTLGRLHQHRRTETCSRVLEMGKICDLRRRMNFPPASLRSRTLFISSRSICFCFVLVLSHEIFCTIRYLCSLLVQSEKSYVFFNFPSLLSLCRLGTLTTNGNISLQRFVGKLLHNYFLLLVFFFFSYRLNYFTLIAPDSILKQRVGMKKTPRNLLILLIDFLVFELSSHARS